MLLKVNTTMEVEELEKRIHVEQDLSLLFLEISMSFRICAVVFDYSLMLSLNSSNSSRNLMDIDQLIARDVHR